MKEAERGLALMESENDKITLKDISLSLIVILIVLFLSLLLIAFGVI